MGIIGTGPLTDDETKLLEARLADIGKRHHWITEEEERGARLSGGGADGRDTEEKVRLEEETYRILDRLQSG